MLYIIVIVGVIGHICCDQTLSYTTDDILNIPYSRNIILSSFMSTKANESITGSDIKMQILFNQSLQEDKQKYNIIYFDLQNTNGIKCYREYFNNNLTNNTMVQTPCRNQSINDLAKNYSCYNLTSCQNESFTFTMQLSQDQFTQNILIIENIHPQNTNQTSLFLNARVIMYFQASIAWFYGSVALTCLLLINIVFLTGVTLYWILKYRKVKRSYEQFKLTETDYEESQLGKPMKEQ